MSAWLFQIVNYQLVILGMVDYTDVELAQLKSNSNRGIGL